MTNVQPWFRQGSQNVAAGLTINLITYTVPPRRRFLLKELGTYASAQAAFGNLTWRVKVNGVSQFPFDNMVDQLGSQSTPVDIGQYVIVQGGDLLTIEVSNAVGAPQTFGAGVLAKGELINEFHRMPWRG